MSTSVKIALTPSSEIQLSDLIDAEKYAFGTRDEEGNFKPGDVAHTTVIFDRRKIGRGVELTFEENYIEVRLCAPTATSDYDVFVALIENLIKILGVKEIICEEENLDVAKIDEAYKTAKINMRSALDFITSVPLQQTGPITFFGVSKVFSIDPTTQHKLRTDKQAALNELLYKNQQLMSPKETR